MFGTSAEYRGAVRKVARALRQEGLRVEPALDDPNVRNGLKHANRLGAKFVVMIADEEYKAGAAVVKDMVGSTQQTLAYAEVPGFLKNALQRRAD